jgi:hypothetical protein
LNDAIDIAGEKFMNKKYIGSILAVIIVIGVGLFIPDVTHLVDRLAGGDSTPVQEKNLTPSAIVTSTLVNKASVTPKGDVKVDSSKTTASNTVSVETTNKQPTSDNNSNNISNHSSNQVSRGGTAVDTSQYPLLSKVNGSFGQFRYRDLSGGRIEVDPQWVAENIVTITLPGLNRQVQVHKDAADHFITAFNYIKNGTAIINGQQVSLLSLLDTMDGTYVTRHVNWNSERGLSNHSWGTAIDINADGHFGYVDPDSDPNDPNVILWEKAFKPAGFSWGNRYSDSMHYELII